MMTIRIWHIFCVIAAAALLLSQPIKAQDIFTIEGLMLDEQAANAQDARRAALREGRLDAWTKLMERLVPTSALDRVPALEARQIEALVRDFGLYDEQASAVRYLATMTVRFDADLVRAELRAARVPFSETRSRPVLVLPLLKASAFSAYALWEDPNPWRTVWETSIADQGLVPVLTALGDLEDFSTVGPSEALSRPTEAMSFLKLKYGVDRVVTAQVEIEDTFDGQRARVILSLPQADENLHQETALVSGRFGQSIEELLEQAAARGRQIIEDDWKRQTQLNFDEFGLLTAMVPLAALEDWLYVERRLNTLPMIERVQLQAMTRDRAQVTIYFIGRQEQLNLALAQSDLDLIWTTDVWTLAPAGDQRPGDPGPEPAIR